MYGMKTRGLPGTCRQLTSLTSRMTQVERGRLGHTDPAGAGEAQLEASVDRG
jgi:hypothetical protein